MRSIFDVFKNSYAMEPWKFTNVTIGIDHRRWLAQINPRLDELVRALAGGDEWTAANIDAALEPLPEQMDLKKRVVFQAVRVAVCGNMVSPPLGETMALVDRDDCLARIDRARTMAL